MYSKFIQRIKYLLFDVHNDWQIGIIDMSVEQFLEQEKLPDIRWFKQPISTYRADPFLIYENNKYYLFYEDFVKAKNYGNISYKVLDSTLKEVETGIAIDEETHFSFPMVFNYNEFYYMVPETAEKGRLSLYKAQSFPAHWVEERVLLNIPCADPVLFFWNNRWYLFYSKNNDNPNVNLYMRSCKDLFDDWENTKEILIKSNIKNARNAGAFIYTNENLYRPAQNCSTYYGQSVFINKVITIEDSCFEELELKEILGPKNFNTGFHTLTQANRVLAVDGRREILSAKPLKSILKSVLNKIVK